MLTVILNIQSLEESSPLCFKDYKHLPTLHAKTFLLKTGTSSTIKQMGKQTQPVLEEKCHCSMPGSAVAEGKASLQPTVQEICHHLSININCGRINVEKNLGNKMIESHAHGLVHRLALQN